jgi:outer membrane protein assembly factor BamB
LILLLLSVVLSACGSVAVSQDWPGLTVAGGTVYVISGLPHKVTLLDAKTGDPKQTFVPQPAPQGTFYWSPVALGGGLAFVGLGVPEAKSYALYAFDPQAGTMQWQVPATNLILAAPVYADGVVYFGTSDGELFAVDAQTRAVKAGWPFKAQNAIWGSPLVANGRVYVPSMDHHLYCLDAVTGKQLWAFDARGAIAVQPTLDPSRGVLYVGDFAGRVYAIQADSGNAVEGFSFQAKNWIWSEALVAGDRLYVTSLDGYLYTLDPATGSPLTSGFKAGDVVRAAPVQSGDLILVASQQGKLTAINGKTGDQIWQWPGTTALWTILSTPVVADGVIYVVTIESGKPAAVYGVTAETGVQAPGNWPAPPAPTP